MRLNQKFGLVVLTCMLALVLPKGMVLAHHSRAAYGNQDKKLQGTVVEYRWRNPHVMVFFDVKDETGTVVRWMGEMAAVTSMMRDGMTKDSLKRSDDITIIVRPNKAGTPESVHRDRRVLLRAVGVQ